MPPCLHAWLNCTRACVCVMAVCACVMVVCVCARVCADKEGGLPRLPELKQPLELQVSCNAGSGCVCVPSHGRLLLMESWRQRRPIHSHGVRCWDASHDCGCMHECPH